MTETSDRPRVTLVYALPDASVEQELRERAEVVTPVTDGPGGLADALRGAHGVILRGPAQLTGELIRGAVDLRVIGAQGSGTDNIDVAVATERGIPVIHGAGVAPVPVAEWVIGAMVAGHRRLRALHETLASGEADWSNRLDEYRGMQLTGTTLGIVGYGHIGREVARMARAAFGVDVLVFDPYLPADAALNGVRRCDDLGELLDASDTVTVHVPLSEDTRGLLGAAELKRIGPDGVLVDAARGGVVDEQAIVAALEGGQLKAAVIDVFDPEPPDSARTRRLGQVPNLLMTPHVAGVTDQGLRDLSRNVVEGVLAALDGRRPERLVNPGVIFPPTM